MAVQTFDPQDLIVTIKGVSNDGADTAFDHTISGFSETFLTVSRPNSMWNTQVGAQGNVVRVKTNDTMADVNFTLQQSSPSHAVLSAFADRATGTDQAGNNVATLSIRYRGQADPFFESSDVWADKVADSTLGNTPQDWEWNMKCATSVYVPANTSLVQPDVTP